MSTSASHGKSGRLFRDMLTKCTALARTKQMKQGILIPKAASSVRLMQDDWIASAQERLAMTRGFSLSSLPSLRAEQQSGATKINAGFIYAGRPNGSGLLANLMTGSNTVANVRPTARWFALTSRKIRHCAADNRHREWLLVSPSHTQQGARSVLRRSTSGTAAGVTTKYPASTSTFRAFHARPHAVETRSGKSD